MPAEAGRVVLADRVCGRADRQPFGEGNPGGGVTRSYVLLYMLMFVVVVILAALATLFAGRT
jgi:hypothetical protein